MLLRNTFNIEIYNEFLKQKREMRSEFKEEYFKRENEMISMLTRGDKDIDAVNERVKRRMTMIKDKKTSVIKRDMMLKLLQDEHANAGKINSNFF